MAYKNMKKQKAHIKEIRRIAKQRDRFLSIFKNDIETTEVKANFWVRLRNWFINLFK